MSNMTCSAIRVVAVKGNSRRRRDCVGDRADEGTAGKAKIGCPLISLSPIIIRAVRATEQKQTYVEHNIAVA